MFRFSESPQKNVSQDTPCSCFCTSPMRDVDRGVGGGAVPSSCNSIDRDGVVSTGIQTGDGGVGLGA